MKFDKWFKKLQSIQQIREISIFINNTCNLFCPYCYVKGMSSAENECATNQQWLPFLQDAIKDGVQLISIVGKEPFMTPDKTIGLLSALNNYTGVRKGVVSNLTLMTPSIAKQLSYIENLYIDFTLDGLEKIHNVTRGAGNFAKTLRGVKLLKGAGVNDLFVSHMLNANNINTFPEFVKFCGSNSLQKFSVFPLCSLDDKDPLHASSDKYCRAIDNAISGKLEIEGAEIIFKSDYLTPEITNKIIKRYIHLNRLKEDKNGVLYDSYRDKKGNIFYFNFLPFPIEFISALRINHRGDIVFCSEMLSCPEGPGRKIINISTGYKAVKEMVNSKQVKDFYNARLKK